MIKESGKPNKRKWEEHAPPQLRNPLHHQPQVLLRAEPAHRENDDVGGGGGAPGEAEGWGLCRGSVIRKVGAVNKLIESGIEEGGGIRKMN
jgi:hypothetical protein